MQVCIILSSAVSGIAAHILQTQDDFSSGMGFSTSAKIYFRRAFSR
jgi:hypothetical protein